MSCYVSYLLHCFSIMYWFRDRLQISLLILGEYKEIDYKDTLMQIWKSPYMFVFIWKQYPANFAFLILRILELFMRD